MKLILTVLGVVLLVVAAVYFLLPADQLPGFFPGHEAGVARMHYQARHRVGRGRRRAAGGGHVDGDGGERSADRLPCRGANRRRDADVAAGHEPCASPHPECPPARRPHRLRLGRKVLDLARDRRLRFGAGGGLGRRAASSRATASWSIPRTATRCSGRCSRPSGSARSGCRPISG